MPNRLLRGGKRCHACLTPKKRVRIRARLQRCRRRVRNAALAAADCRLCGTAEGVPGIRITGTIERLLGIDGRDARRSTPGKLAALLCGLLFRCCLWHGGLGCGWLGCRLGTGRDRSFHRDRLSWRRRFRSRIRFCSSFRVRLSGRHCGRRCRSLAFLSRRCRRSTRRGRTCSCSLCCPSTLRRRRRWWRWWWRRQRLKKFQNLRARPQFSIQQK